MSPTTIFKIIHPVRCPVYSSKRGHPGMRNDISSIHKGHHFLKLLFDFLIGGGMSNYWQNYHELSYDEQLQTPHWMAKRSEILERDDYCCQDCLRGTGRNSKHLKLHVHHRKYIDGLLAWEYPNTLLITLCEECHGKLHGHIEDLRNERLKPTFVYGVREFESKPVLHVRDVIIQMIQSMIDGKG